MKYFFSTTIILLLLSSFFSCNKNNITQENDRKLRASLTESYIFNQEKTEKMSDWLMGVTSSRTIATEPLPLEEAMLNVEAVLNYNFSRRVSGSRNDFIYDFNIEVQLDGNNLSAANIQKLFNDIRANAKAYAIDNNIYNNSNYNLNYFDLELKPMVGGGPLVSVKVEWGYLAINQFRRQMKAGDNYYPSHMEGNCNYGQTANVTYTGFSNFVSQLDWGAPEVLTAMANYNLLGIATISSTTPYYIPNPTNLDNGWTTSWFSDPSNPFQNLQPLSAWGGAIPCSTKTALYQTPDYSITGGLTPCIPYDEMNYYLNKIVDHCFPLALSWDAPTYTINNITRIKVYANNTWYNPLPWNPHTYSLSSCGGDFGIWHGIQLFGGNLVAVTSPLSNL